jgi:hypothetical protein
VAIQQALEAAGVEFIAENGGGPGVRLKKGEPWRPFLRAGQGNERLRIDQQICIFCKI